MVYFDFLHPFITYIVYITLFSLLAIWMAFFPSGAYKHQKTLYWLFFLFIAYSQIVRYLLPLLEGHFNFPFFVSRMASLLMLVYFIFRFKAMHGILYFWTSTGVLAVFIPMGSFANMANLPDTFLIDHFIGGVFPLYLLSVKQYKPSYKAAHIYAFILLVIFLVYIPFAQMYGLRYFFMHEGNFLLEFFPRINWYLFAVLKAVFLWLYFLLFTVFGRWLIDVQKLDSNK